jgi:hypothetical protein
MGHLLGRLFWQLRIHDAIIVRKSLRRKDKYPSFSAKTFGSNHALSLNRGDISKGCFWARLSNERVENRQVRAAEMILSQTPCVTYSVERLHGPGVGVASTARWKRQARKSVIGAELPRPLGETGRVSRVHSPSGVVHIKPAKCGVRDQGR